MTGVTLMPSTLVRAASPAAPDGGVAGCLSARGMTKGGAATPDTGTPPARSLSPSSDGASSLAPSERGPRGKTAAEPAGTAGVKGGAGASAAVVSAADAVAGGAAGELLDGNSPQGQEAPQAAATSGKAQAAGQGGARGGRTKPRVGRWCPAIAPEAVATEAAGGADGSDVVAAAGHAADGCQGAKVADNEGGETATDGQPTDGCLPEDQNQILGAEDFAHMPVGGLPFNSFSDRRIIEVLAAPEQTHRRLLLTARLVPEVIMNHGEHALASSVELYGSLALDMTEPALLRSWKQDWASYYVNGRSDVDFVVETRHRVSPAAIVQTLLKKGPWRIVGQVQVHKFASTQFTLLGSFEEDGGSSSEVYLDITCIEHSLHFNRFKKRQEAFRKVFLEVRSRIEVEFAQQGALAFDAYIHLLKAFAAKIPGSALTGFQATCIGLFVLQLGYFRLKHSIALSFFEGFLRFCLMFYGEIPQGWHYRQHAIDLTGGGRWLTRMSTAWRTEMYFMHAEMKMHTRPDERVNVTHSLEPERVAAEALALLSRSFGPVDWDRLAGTACFMPLA